MHLHFKKKNKKKPSCMSYLPLPYLLKSLSCPGKKINETSLTNDNCIFFPPNKMYVQIISSTEIKDKHHIKRNKGQIIRQTYNGRRPNLRIKKLQNNFCLKITNHLTNNASEV